MIEPSTNYFHDQVISGLGYQLLGQSSIWNHHMANQKGMLWVLEPDKSLRGDGIGLLTRGN